MKYQIEIDDPKILAEKYFKGKIYRWIYNSVLTDNYQLIFVEIEKDTINYIHICHPDDFILEDIEQSFKEFYFDYDLLKIIEATGEY